MEKINKALQDLDCIEPFITFEEPMAEVSHEMMEGLAKLFADKGLRSYLENEYKRALKSSALQSRDIHDIMFSKGRILTLKELLVKARVAFQSYNKINGN